MKKIFSSSNPLVQKPLRFYGKYQKYLPIASFFAGFSWDNLTLGRIDRLLDSLILLLYLLFLGAVIVLLNLVDKKIIKTPLFLKYREWYPLAIQFLLGGLFSAYLIYYRQSASLTKTALFLIILLLLLVANEFLKNRLTNIYLQMSLYFLASFSFFIFFLPVITKIINLFMFILGGILSLGLVIGMLYLLFKKTALKSREEFRRVAILIGSIYLLLNLFYFLNWIPPIPLSLKLGGIYHHVQRDDDLYRLRFEQPAWYQFFKTSDNSFHYAPGDTVYCFTSIFAPTSLKTKIYHHWQKYSPNRESWETTDRISFPITGGRDGGYRGYSLKRYVSPGEWQITVETENGRLLGKISFHIVQVEEPNYRLKTIRH
jgi:hypothetical protein